MSKKATLTNVSSGYSSGATLNDNFERLNKQFENTVSLDGSVPNAMGGDLDLDSNNLLNVGRVEVDELYLVGEKVVTVGTTPKWEGSWTAGKNYALNDIVQYSGSSYIATQPHTSGSFSADLSSHKWELMVQQGSAGPGTGDMLAANNLSDLTDTLQARANLGVGNLANEYAARHAGFISYFAGAYTPQGWLYCDGREVNRFTYDDLYNVIGTLYGSGNGTSTFNLPDLRGEFIRGLDSGRGVDIGRSLGSWQDHEFESHNHDIIGVGDQSPMYGGGYQAIRPGQTPRPTTYAGGSETRPRNIALRPCIST